MKKHEYELVFNKPSKSAKVYTYNYSATRGKNIKLAISKSGIRIIVVLSSLYESQKLITSSNHIFSDAIKKALMLYLLIYSKNIDIKKMIVRINDAIEEIEIPSKPYNPPIYSLVVKELYSKISNEWNNRKFFDAILSKPPSYYREDNRWAALYATICAKSKIYEVERFMYFWMAFNGIYGYFSKFINAQKNEKRHKEYKQINWLLKLSGYGNEGVHEDDSVIIAREVISCISKYDIYAIKSTQDIPTEIRKGIKRIVAEKGSRKYNITPEGYIITGLAYYFRCNYFHAGRVLPLFCYADERELKCLHLVNTLLEEFIDKNLHLLFDDGYVYENYSEKIEKLSNGKL